MAYNQDAGHTCVNCGASFCDDRISYNRRANGTYVPICPVCHEPTNLKVGELNHPKKA